MAEPARRAPRAEYDRDFAAWAEEQGGLLRARAGAELDWDNLAEEIETLGRSERHEIRSRLLVLLLHLLKWQFQPEKRKGGWRSSIIETRARLHECLEESPSLQGYPAAVLAKEYELARLKAAGETDLPVESFPPSCPWPLSAILDEDFFPADAA